MFGQANVKKQYMFGRANVKKQYMFGRANVKKQYMFGQANVKKRACSGAAGTVHCIYSSNRCHKRRITLKHTILHWYFVCVFFIYFFMHVSMFCFMVPSQACSCSAFGLTLI